MMVKLVLFAALMGIAFVFDAYTTPSSALVETEQKAPEQQNESQETHSVYFIAQNNLLAAKTSVQKSLPRNLLSKAYGKYIRKHHELCNHQVLKAEVQLYTTPLIAAYHYLVFQTCFFTDPDEDSAFTFFC